MNPKQSALLDTRRVLTRGLTYRLIAASSPDLQVVTTSEGIYRYVSDACFEVFGWEPRQLLGSNQDCFTHPDDVVQLESDRAEAAAARRSTVTTVVRMRCADGTYRWTEAVSRSARSSEGTLVVSSVRDISDRKESELALQLQATTDALTGVSNRSVFMDRLHQALLRLERNRGLVAVVFLDLDRFKTINDSVGHLVGDALLVQMAQRLRGLIRPQDTLARWGGDEFAVVVEDIAESDEAMRLGARIVEASRQPFVVGNEQFVCTTSVGIAVTADPGNSAEVLLQEADLALYRAKDEGRDRAEVFDEALRTRAVGRLGTERMLRRAIDEDRLRVSYQPVIDLATGATVGAEALVRVWDPEQDALVVAESFIRVAEETGLMGEIDDWVIAEVIRQSAVWRRTFAGRAFQDVAINITARHLADAGFARSVIDGLAEHGVPAASLQVEVTERVLMEASNSAMSGLKVLRDAGVRVGLDDFGTGHSSLSYLRIFPLDFVKIDRSFIRDLDVGQSEQAIVASVIDLSHALGMAVVAEGVETQAQLDRLTALGCDRAQGYLFSAAVASDEFEGFMRRPKIDRREIDRPEIDRSATGEEAR